VVPKRVAKFFDARWNLVPACESCNAVKRDDIKIELIRTPGKDAFEDAAVWAVVFNLLDAPLEAKKRFLNCYESPQTFICGGEPQFMAANTKVKPAEAGMAVHVGPTLALV
jgi:hypothetical protein